MSVFLVGAGRYAGEDLTALQNLAEFRRATRNMQLAYLAVKEALTGLDLAGLSVGLVVATSHGELEVTTSFLAELGKSGVARPLLFQNSLHNATLGFLARHFQFTGPSVTVSNRFTSGENAIEVADTFLRDELVDVCVVVGVDVLPESVRRVLHPEGKAPVDGAGAVLLASRRGLEKLGNPARAVPWESIAYEKHGDAFYDSDAVERLGRAWKA